MRIENIKNKYLIIVAIFLLAGLFYWFQYRPASIRSYCHKWVVDLPGEIEKFGSESGVTIYNAYFNQCLHEKGLQ